MTNEVDTVAVSKSDLKYAMGFLYSHEPRGESLNVWARLGNALQTEPLPAPPPGVLCDGELRNVVATVIWDRFAPDHVEVFAEEPNKAEYFGAADAAIAIVRNSGSAVSNPPDTLCKRLQRKCSDWGTYWRAPDSHGVEISHEQAVELLEDALGVEVEIAEKSPEHP